MLKVELFGLSVSIRKRLVPVKAIRVVRVIRVIRVIRDIRVKASKLCITSTIVKVTFSKPRELRALLQTPSTFG